MAYGSFFLFAYVAVCVCVCVEVSWCWPLLVIGGFSLRYLWPATPLLLALLIAPSMSVLDSPTNTGKS